MRTMIVPAAISMAAVAATFTLSSPAQAGVIFQESGTLSPQNMSALFSPTIEKGKTYNLNVTFSLPAVFFARFGFDLDKTDIRYNEDGTEENYSNQEGSYRVDFGDFVNPALVHDYTFETPADEVYFQLGPPWPGRYYAMIPTIQYMSLEPEYPSDGTTAPINYTITLSDLTTMSAAPEPATWAMMIMGLGAVGYALRSTRRRNRIVPTVRTA